jgi:hypothetical protein
VSAPGGPAWWLTEAGTLRAMAGPFRRRGEIEDAEPPADESREDLVVDEVYGVVDVDCRVARRMNPDDKAFEAHLSEQLDRIRDDTGRRPAGPGRRASCDAQARWSRSCDDTT